MCSDRSEPQRNLSSNLGSSRKPDLAHQSLTLYMHDICRNQFCLGHCIQVGKFTLIAMSSHCFQPTVLCTKCLHIAACTQSLWARRNVDLLLLAGFTHVCPLTRIRCHLKLAGLQRRCVTHLP